MPPAAPPFGTFFLPGPTEVRPEVLEAMLQPMIPHRGRAFEALFSRVQEGLRHVFRTTRPVFVSSSSATGLMEAAVRCAPPGPVLALVNGAFAERFAQIARQCGRETEVVNAPLGGVVPLDEIARRLAARRYAAVTVVHSETSTGALTDVRAVQALAREHDALCLVDSVTGVGGAPLEFDAWNLDFALTGSQKALALPPGLAFAVASEEYMRHVREAPARGVYFDLAEFERYVARDQTPNTPALSLLYAADRQLARIREEGMEHRWARHRAMAEATWAWGDTLGARLGTELRVLAAPGERSPTVTAITLPVGLPSGRLTAAVAARGYTIGGGYGELKETTFRIGHMGDHTPEGLAACLAAVEAALAD
ncbi:MAG TPA: alanine--glyoxylate aminotransferase family protein [Gemmatimonadaceae bacterium]|nr:alanine--glyoxylate aminotransferase family protein [Gemmatimonadaceae bacterium]